MKNKKWMELASLMTITVFLAATALSCGGGGGSSGPGTITFTDAGQVGAAASDAAGSLDLVGEMSGIASSVAGAGAAQAEYSAPKRSKAVNADTISNIDPRLKTMVDKLKSTLQSAVVINATGKARSKISQSASVILTNIPCNSLAPIPGTYSVHGTDNTGDPSRSEYEEAWVTISFNACKNDIDLTETSGTMQLHWKQMIDLSSNIADVAANITATVYSNNTFSTAEGAINLNGTFNSSYDEIADGIMGSSYSNGSMMMTDYTSDPDLEMTVFFTNLQNDWSITTVSGDTTETTMASGSFGLSVSSGLQSAGLTISLSNLEDKWLNYNDGSIDHWLNGSITIILSPAVCLSGTVTFTTDELTPMHYDSIADTCPVSGTVRVNNATIEFEPAQVTVTVDGQLPVTYLSCDEMANAGEGMMCQ